MTFFRVHVTTYKSIVDNLREGKKIKAIKDLRKDVGCGLKESKLAVERLAHELGITHSLRHESADHGVKIICGPVVKSMIVDYGTGPVELDIEGMQLRALMEMQTIGLDACRDILTLVDTLTAFSEGKMIGVLEDEDEEEEV
jgi:hypothetical protein